MLPARGSAADTDPFGTKCKRSFSKLPKVDHDGRRRAEALVAPLTEWFSAVHLPFI
jgi:hypothetical protein